MTNASTFSFSMLIFIEKKNYSIHQWLPHKYAVKTAMVKLQEKAANVNCGPQVFWPYMLYIERWFWPFRFALLIIFLTTHFLSSWNGTSEHEVTKIECFRRANKSVRSNHFAPFDAQIDIKLQRSHRLSENDQPFEDKQVSTSFQWHFLKIKCCETGNEIFSLPWHMHLTFSQLLVNTKLLICENEVEDELYCVTENAQTLEKALLYNP